jgi:hypothetical protein
MQRAVVGRALLGLMYALFSHGKSASVGNKRLQMLNSEALSPYCNPFRLN